MGLLRALADKFDPVETRSKTSSWDLMQHGGIDLAGALPSNPRAAENLSTVLGCVGAISSALASLPSYIYRFTGAGREIDDNHPLARLIETGPNQHQSWADFIEWLMASTLLRGNGIAEIVTDARGAVVGLRPIPWENCAIQLLPNGRLAYDVSDIVSAFGGTGRTKRLLQGEVLHLRDRSDDGLVGISRLRRASAVLAAGLSMQQFLNSLYNNGAVPSAAVEMDGRLSPEAFERFKKDFRDNFSGPSNAAKLLILENGLKWKSMSVSLEDQEFLASRRFSVEELCRIYGVPPPVVGDLSHASFTNSETMLRWFGQSTLGPWAKKIESEFSRSVFSEAGRRSHRLEIDLAGMLRGAPTERWATYDIAIKNGILDINEIREIEGWNPKRNAGPSSPA